MDLPAELILRPPSITKLSEDSEPTIFLPEFTLQLFIESKLVVRLINEEGIVTNSSSSDIMEPMSCQLRCPVLDILREHDLMTQLVFDILRCTVLQRKFPQICVDLAQRIRSYVLQLAQQGVTRFHIRADALVVVKDWVLVEGVVSNVGLSRGASESALKKLEMERFDDGELMSETCAICLEKLDSSSGGDKNLSKMPCSHV